MVINSLVVAYDLKEKLKLKKY